MVLYLSKFLQVSLISSVNKDSCVIVGRQACDKILWWCLPIFKPRKLSVTWCQDSSNLLHGVVIEWGHLWLPSLCHFTKTDLWICLKAFHSVFTFLLHVSSPASNLSYELKFKPNLEMKILIDNYWIPNTAFDHQSLTWFDLELCSCMLL